MNRAEYEHLEDKENHFYDVVDDYKRLMVRNLQATGNNLASKEVNYSDFAGMMIEAVRMARIASKYGLSEADQIAVKALLKGYSWQFAVEADSIEYKATIAKLNDPNLKQRKSSDEALFDLVTDNEHLLGGLKHEDK